MAQKISNLPIGAKVKLGKYQVETEAAEPIIWLVADRNHQGYPDNSTTLLTEKIIDLRAFDASESCGPDFRQYYGCNRYSLSNIRQWLNKSSKPWFVAASSCDVAPKNTSLSGSVAGYDTKAGFLSSFTADELKLILNTTITTVKPAADYGTSEECTDKIFLLSSTEVGLANENNIAEGSKLAIFTSAASRIVGLTQQAYNNTKASSKPSQVSGAWQYALRTPYYSDVYNVRAVKEDGALNYLSAFYCYIGLRPATNISSDTLVSDTTDSSGCYTIQHNAAPTISPGDTSYGDKKAGFTIPYTVTDTAGDTFTITVKLDNQLMSTQTDQSGSVSGVVDLVAKWPSLSLGIHTVTITATDQLGAAKTNTYTFSKTNSAPVISGTDKDLGEKLTDFDIEYTVSDADAADTITVVEYLDTEIINTINEATKDVPYTIKVPVSRLSLGDHTVKIVATDTVGNIVTRIYTFKYTLKSMYGGMINSPVTVITSGIGLDTMSIPIMDATVFPEGPNLAVIGTGPEAETVLYSAVNSNTSSLTIAARGFEGKAKAWPSGSVVARNYTNYDYMALVENIKAMHKTMGNANLEYIDSTFKDIKASTIRISNITIPTSAWQFDASTGLYKVAYNDAKIFPEYVPYVNINTLGSIKIATEAGVMSFAETVLGELRLYAQSIPGGTITCDVQLIKEVV